MYKHSFLMLGLVATLGISADFTPPHGAYPMPADYEEPLVVNEKPNTQRSTINKAVTLTASIIASAIAIGAIVFVDSCIDPTASPFMKGKHKLVAVVIKGTIVGLAATGIFETLKDFGLKPKERSCLLIALLIASRNW